MHFGILQRWLVITLLLIGLHESLAAEIIQVGLKDNQKSMTLTEGWLFHAHRLLDVQALDPSYAGHSVQLPGNWNDYPDPIKGGTFGAKGCGTFVIEFKGLEPIPQGYELLLMGAATAYQLTLVPRDELHAARRLSNGQVSCDSAGGIPQILPQTLSFHSKGVDQVWRLVIQVSNFHYASGGLWNPIQIFPAGTGSRQLLWKQHGDLLCNGAMLIIGLYSLMLFWGRREDKGSLILGLDCFCMIIRTISATDFIAFYDPRPDVFLFNLKYKLEYSMLCLGPTLFLLFIAHMFPRQANRRVLSVFAVSGITTAAVTLLLSPAVFSSFLMAYLMHTWAVVAYMVIVAWRAFWQKEEDVNVVVLGGVVICLAIVYDSCVTFSLLPGPFIIQYGVAFFIFMQSQIVSRRFAKAFHTARILGEELQQEVARQTRDIRAVMINVPQGIFQLRPDLSIDPTYSLHLEQIIGTRNLSGQKFADIILRRCQLSNDALQHICEILRVCYNETLLVWELNAAGLPHELKFHDSENQLQILEVDWHPVTDSSEIISAFLVTIRNVSDLRQLQKDAAEKQEDLILLGELLHCRRSSLPTFFTEFHQTLALENQRWMDDDVLSTPFLKELMLRLHTLKGAARTFGFLELATLVHEAEHSVEGQLKGTGEALDRSRLEDQIQGILHCVGRYEKLDRTLAVGSHQETMPTLAADLENTLLDIYQLNGPATQKFQQIWQRFCQISRPYLYCKQGEAFELIMQLVQPLAQELGKPEPKINLSGDQVWLSRKAIRVLDKVFRHIFTNALDHGIENAEERLALGKTSFGQIHIGIGIAGDRLRLNISDDGRGLNLEILRQKMVKGGLLTKTEAQDTTRLLNCLFAEGFSTADRLTLHSGRGVGMPAVRHLLEAEGARIHLQLVPRQGDMQPALGIILDLPHSFFLSETSHDVLPLSS